MKMRTLTDEKLINIIRETYEDKLRTIREDLDVVFPVDGTQSNVLSKGLKLRDKQGKLYTIDSIGDWGAFLIPAFEDEENAQPVKVDIEELENDYEL